MKIDDLTLGQIKELQNVFRSESTISTHVNPHPMIGRRCLIRTYSAGVHIGDVVDVVDGTQVHLKNALRLWKWTGGGLSLSAVAANGIKGGRLNKTGEIVLQNAIEFIPTSIPAEETYVKFIED